MVLPAWSRLGSVIDGEGVLFDFRDAVEAF